MCVLTLGTRRGLKNCNTKKEIEQYKSGIKEFVNKYVETNVADPAKKAAVKQQMLFLHQCCDEWISAFEDTRILARTMHEQIGTKFLHWGSKQVDRIVWRKFPLPSLSIPSRNDDTSFFYSRSRVFFCAHTAKLSTDDDDSSTDSDSKSDSTPLDFNVLAPPLPDTDAKTICARVIQEWSPASELLTLRASRAATAANGTAAPAAAVAVPLATAAANTTVPSTASASASAATSATSAAPAVPSSSTNGSMAQVQSVLVPSTGLAKQPSSKRRRLTKESKPHATVSASKQPASSATAATSATPLEQSPPGQQQSSQVQQQQELLVAHMSANESRLETQIGQPIVRIEAAIHALAAQISGFQSALMTKLESQVAEQNAMQNAMQSALIDAAYKKYSQSDDFKLLKASVGYVAMYAAAKEKKQKKTTAAPDTATAAATVGGTAAARPTPTSASASASASASGSGMVISPVH